jgi:beta-mannosidase
MTHKCEPVRRFDLSGLDWQLTGWRPYEWQATNITSLPEIGPIPVRVPGSVQSALRAAGLLPDWEVKDLSRGCEWVEHRHWMLETEVPADWLCGPGWTAMHCKALDYRGHILVDRRPVGEFAGSFTPYTLDLTDHVDADRRRLGIVFTGHPPHLGQVYFTSRVAEQKPRFYYGWDWVPRLVQTGVCDELSLVRVHGHTLERVRCQTDYERSTGTGRILLTGVATSCADAQLDVTVIGNGTVLVSQRQPAQDRFDVTVDVDGVEPWRPNRCGDRSLYTVRLALLDDTDTTLDSWERTTGFREITWTPCEGAPSDALPWICVVNGVPLFLQGFNWVPIRPFYADLDVTAYRGRLETYQRLGANVLRVWGGAPLERECFYELCDELGILVWQDLPLSSSGIDDLPPDDPTVVDQWVEVAKSYVERRQHHPSVLLWCGGNELQEHGEDGGGRPLGLEHPMLAALECAVSELDPLRRFLPTSPTGPRFMADEMDFGHGLHHEVHGPWWAPEDEQAWTAYWSADDALFRSELGMPGSSTAELIRRFGQELAWPADPDNPFWVHTCAWWHRPEWHEWQAHAARAGEEDSLEAFVAWSRRRQARYLSTAVTACKARFPQCGGVIVWMGHDCHPCPINTSVLDFDGCEKPAARALAQIFRTPPDRLPKAHAKENK